MARSLLDADPKKTEKTQKFLETLLKRHDDERLASLLSSSEGDS